MQERGVVSLHESAMMRRRPCKNNGTVFGALIAKSVQKCPIIFARVDVSTQQKIDLKENLTNKHQLESLPSDRVE